MIQNKYLTLEEELALGRIIKSYNEGTGATFEEYTNARLQLLESNQKFALKQVHKFMKRVKSATYELEDAIQDVLLAMYEDTARYNPDYGNKFSTLAGWMINKTLSEKAYKSSKIPINISTGYRLNEISKLINSKPVDSPESDVEYIMNRTKYKRSDIVFILSILSGVTSLNYTTQSSSGETTDELGTFIKDTKDSFIEYERKDFVNNLLSGLNSSERAIINYKFELDGAHLELDTLLEELDLTKDEYNKKVRDIIKRLKKTNRGKSDWNY